MACKIFSCERNKKSHWGFNERKNSVVNNFNVHADFVSSALPLKATSTTASLEPDNVEIPYLDRLNGPTVVTVKLHINNVYNMSNITVTLDYNSNIKFSPVISMIHFTLL